MRPWLGAQSTLHICMPARDSATPLAVSHKAKHCYTHKLYQSRRGQNKRTRSSAVNEERSTGLYNSKQAGAHTRAETQCSFHTSEPPRWRSDEGKDSKGVDKPDPKQSQPAGELQLLPNRRFFLAGLGSLTIGDQPHPLQATCCVMTAYQTSAYHVAVLVSNPTTSTVGHLLCHDRLPHNCLACCSASEQPWGRHWISARAGWWTHSQQAQDRFNLSCSRTEAVH